MSEIHETHDGPSYDELMADLKAKRATFKKAGEACSVASGHYRAGLGGWWELSGYAHILDDAIRRCRAHRRRAEGVQRRIDREAKAGGSNGR